MGPQARKRVLPYLKKLKTWCSLLDPSTIGCIFLFALERYIVYLVVWIDLMCSICSAHLLIHSAKKTTSGNFFVVWYHLIVFLFIKSEQARCDSCFISLPFYCSYVIFLSSCLIQTLVETMLEVVKDIILKLLGTLVFHHCLRLTFWVLEIIQDFF